MLDNIEVFTQSSIRIKSSQGTIYLDSRLPGLQKRWASLLWDAWKRKSSYKWWSSTCGCFRDSSGTLIWKIKQKNQLALNCVSMTEQEISNTMEIFDITDDNGIPTGKTITRSEAHDKGIPHRTAHIWIVKRDGDSYQVLLQKRSAEKESFPGMFDTSSAGHIQAGDDPLESAQRWNILCADRGAWAGNGLSELCSMMLILGIVNGKVPG